MEFNFISWFCHNHKHNPVWFMVVQGIKFVQKNSGTIGGTSHKASFFGCFFCKRSQFNPLL